MRQDTPVTLLHLGRAEYDPLTGSRKPAVKRSWRVYANVSPIPRQEQLLIFGKLNQKSAVVRVNGSQFAPFDHFEIEGVQYRVRASRQYRDKLILWGKSL